MVKLVEHQIQKALYEIADAASAVTDIQSFYKRLHKIVGELMYAKSFYVTLYDQATGLLSSPYFADETGDEPPPPTRIDNANKSLRAHVLLHGKTLHLSGTEIEEGRLLGKFEPMGTPTEDWIGVPLKMDGQVIGSLTVQSYEKGVHYKEQDVRLLEFVAQHIAVALTRARAIEETRQRNTELQVINSVQQGLASNLDIQSIYTLVGDKLREIFAADTTFIAFKDDAKGLLHVRYYADRVLRRSFSRPYRTGIAEVIIESGNSLLLRNELEQQKLGALHVVSPSAQKDLNQSVLGVPILRGAKAHGAVTVQSYQVNAFDENDLRLLQTLTNAMSVALENARLFNETQQRNAELAIINSVQQGLASKLNVQAIYELVGEKIRQTFNAQVVSIVTYDEATQLMYGRYYFENGTVLPGITLPSFGFRKHVVESGEPIIIHKDMRRWIEEYHNPVLQGIEPKSAIFIPMKVGEETTGVISLQNNDQENAFTETDVRLLTTLANSMNVALENARLFEETQQRNEELAIINSVQAGLASKLDIQAIYKLIGEKVREVFHVEVIDIVNYDPVSNLISMPYSYERGDRSVFSPREPYGFRQQVIESRAPLLITENFEELASQFNNPLLTGVWPKSALFMPLLVEGQVKSIISIQDIERENAFSTSDVQLLQTLSNAMAVALENARLFDETQRLFQAERQAHEQAETLRSVAQALNRSLSLTEVFHLVLTEIQKVIPYDSAGIYQVHGNRRVFVAGRGFANLEALVGVSFEFNPQEDEIGYLISRSLQPLILEDAPEKYPQYFGTGTHAATKIRSYMAVPIVLNQKLIGMITLDREEPGFYNKEHAGLAMAFAAQAATAINNAQLFDETQQRSAELAIINSVQAGLASQLDIQGIYELVGDKIREIFDANTVLLATFDLQEGLMHRRYIIERGTRYFLGPTPIPQVWAQFIQQGQSTLINNDLLQFMQRMDPTFEVLVGEVPKSALSVPLRIQGETRGVISLQNVDRENAFSRSDLRLLETLANSMSVALENAWLWEQEKLYRRALERELEIGREIQAGFLPEELPLVEGWEIAASLMSAREVAGDFYDAFELPGGNIALVIADVCDKGVGAALFMTLFRSLLRITANQEYFQHTQNANASHSTGERLQRAMSLTNNYIAETHQDSGMFATIFFGILDPGDGKLTYINGGHEPPLIVRSAHICESLCRTGPAVGALLNCHFDVGTANLNPGEMFIAFTDGAPEAKNPHGEFFGHERLHDILRQCNRSSQEWVNTLEAELRQYMGSATQFDDITLLAVKRGYSSS